MPAIEGINAADQVVPLPPAVAEAAAQVRFRWVIEGVCDGDEFTDFDLREFATQDFRTLNYGTRFAGLRHLGFPVGRHFKIAQIAVEIG